MARLPLLSLAALLIGGFLVVLFLRSHDGSSLLGTASFTLPTSYVNSSAVFATRQRVEQLLEQVEQLQEQVRQAELRSDGLQQQLDGERETVASLQAENAALEAERQKADAAEDGGSNSSAGGCASSVVAGLQTAMTQQQHRADEAERRAEQVQQEAKDRQGELDGCLDDLRTAAEADREQLAALLAAQPSILENRTREISSQLQRGILVSVGHGVHVANAFVNLHVLRHTLGCTLPVAITYYGAAEGISDKAKAFIQEEVGNVTFWDTSKPPYPSHQRPVMRKNVVTFVEGWKLKVYGFYQAPFQEILFLDSDCMPLLDPTALFDSPEYQKHGSLFFPDRISTPPRDEEHQLYKHFGLHNPWAGDKSTWPNQADTGALLLNRLRHADMLEWLLFLNNHDEFTYRMAFGDKDTFRAAFDLADKRDMFFQSPHTMGLALLENPGPSYAWRGYVHLAPNGSVAFIHRSWFTKYDAGRDDLRAFTHVTNGLSAERAMVNHFFSRDFTKEEVESVSPECPFDPYDMAGSARRCMLDPADTSLPMPAWKIPPDSAMAALLLAADEAFMRLRTAKQTRPGIAR